MGGGIPAAWALLLTSLAVEGVPINPRFFSFSTYAGAVTNLTYDDASMKLVANALHIGSLRYPGGSVGNSWDLSTGRWVDSVQSDYAKRNRAFPAGTFTPKNFVEGWARYLRAPPIWNLNLMQLNDTPGQIDTLRDMQVPVKFLELGNEVIDKDQDAYFAAAEPVVARARAVFPNASISAVGCFGLPWAPCAAKLKQVYETKRLFDAVSIHHYDPVNHTIISVPGDAERRSATLSFTYNYLRTTAAQVARDISPNVPIWLDEFNWGGPWAPGGNVWPLETHGGLRGLYLANFILSAIDVTEEANANGTAGYDTTMYYSLLYQNTSGWSHWASCADIPNELGRRDLVRFDGVAQISAHLNYVALKSNYTDMKTLRGLSDATIPSSVRYNVGSRCVVAVKFSGDEAGSSTIVAVNICPSKVKATLPGGGGYDATMATYSGFDVGGWVLASEIESLWSPPWQNAPLTVATTAMNTNSFELPAVSLSFISM